MKTYLVWSIVLMLGALLFMFVAGREREVAEFPGFFSVIFAFAALLCAFSSGENAAKPQVSENQVVKVLAVWGEGNAVVEFPNGKTTVINSCPADTSVGTVMRKTETGYVKYP